VTCPAGHKKCCGLVCPQTRSQRKVSLAPCLRQTGPQPSNTYFNYRFGKKVVALSVSDKVSKTFVYILMAKSLASMLSLDRQIQKSNLTYVFYNVERHYNWLCTDSRAEKNPYRSEMVRVFGNLWVRVRILWQRI
jgi:hypothetical protein